VDVCAGERSLEKVPSTCHALNYSHAYAISLRLAEVGKLGNNPSFFLIPCTSCVRFAQNITFRFSKFSKINVYENLQS